MRMVERRIRRILALPGVAALAVATVGISCAFQAPVVKQLDVSKPPVEVKAPVKAHMKDGSTVVFPNGLVLRDNTLTGVPAYRYPFGSSTAGAAAPIPIDSVVGMETFGRKVNVPATVVASLAGTALASFGAVALAVAIFGSCPTFYADSAGTELLQAEGFSYSIAPLFEQRDVDRLRLTVSDGKVTLNVRNEALETHYINHVELLEILHGADELALPDQTGRAIAVARTDRVSSVIGREGEDVSGTVGGLDGVVYVTPDNILRGVTAENLDDYLDITIPAPEGADTVALVLDMRNSLLNTVLLYDNILGSPGLKSLDWIGNDLGNISQAVDLGRWYAAHMGMRVSVLDGTAYRAVARLGDSGPIAFHKVAVLVPVVRSAGDSIRIRLSFVADDWRIDQIAIARSWRRPDVRTIAVSRVAMAVPSENARAGIALRDADEAYLITGPGQSFKIEFDVGAGAGSSRSWLLASQGYYSEWVRGSWIKSASGKPFVPSNETLVDAIRGWRAKQGDMEKRFYSDRISAR